MEVLSLKFFKPVPSILKYQHFHVSSKNPGVVELEELAVLERTAVDIRKAGMEIDPSQMPTLITSPGLSLERQTYLYEQIRVFCELEYADATCPKPVYSMSEASIGTAISPAKRVRLCSHCKQPGAYQESSWESNMPESLELISSLLPNYFLSKILPSEV